MKQETLTYILDIEKEASQIHDQAQSSAEQILKKAQKETQDLHERIMTQAHQEANRIITRGREAAEVERAQVLARAGATAQHLETLASRHLDRAVDFILDEITERPPQDV